MNIIEAFRVYNVNSPKIRVGNENDGGYIVNELLTTNSKRLISIGMGSEDEFERDWFSRYQTIIEAYDGTYPCQSLCAVHSEYVNKKIFYVNHNVGYDEKLIPINTIVEGKPDVLLKVDVEGAEYSLFDNVDLSNITGLIIELHYLHERQHQLKIIDLIQNKFNHLLLFHVHGNSWGNTFTLNLTGTGIGSLAVEHFPYVIELSFINKSLVDSYELETQSFPVNGLDTSNNRNASDIELKWINSL